MRRLLIVDDNAQNLYLLQVLLSAQGFQVEQASNGAEALARARDAAPDMIVSDILMPVMDGFSLCREWKQDERLRHIPFVFYTATYTDPKDEDFALRMGADRFIIKPVEPDRFLALLQETLDHFKSGKPVALPPQVQETEYHEQYNAALVRKLEDKMLQLEEANRALERDIAERQRSERALKESESKVRSIMDNIGIGIAIIGSGKTILEVNHRMQKWFPGTGAGQESVCHRLFNDTRPVVPDDDCPTCKALRDGLAHEAVMQSPQPDGVRNYRIVSTPIVGSHGEIAAAIEMVEDITERLSLESQVRQGQKMEAVGQLAGGMAHDFNNMLTVVLGHAELALQEVDRTHPLHTRLTSILDVATRSSGIIRQLLAFARKQDIAPVVLDLNRIVDGMIKVIRRLIGEDIHLDWIPEPNLWLVKMDPTQMEQILTNLCVNARDAIAGVGSITIETGNAVFDEAYCAHHAEFAAGEYAMLAISDNGCGMEKNILDRIFEPFFTTKEVGQGTGLGLSTVYGIVRQNNGFIHVYSEKGKGTTFKVYLTRHGERTTDAQKESDWELPLSTGETVLVVEDDVTVLELASGILDRLGYTVLTADTPGAAMRLIDEHPGEIHLLMTDVILPEMTGRDLAEEIKKARPSMKCLFMSGYTDDVITGRGMLDAGVPFITKPFSIRGLATKVRTALEK